MNKNRTNIESAIDALEKLLFESENNIFLLEMDYERKAIESQLQEKLNEIKKLELIVKNENYTNTEVFKKIGVKKVNPRIIQIISIGAIAGLFLSILLAFFRNALSKEPE